MDTNRDEAAENGTTDDTDITDDRRMTDCRGRRARREEKGNPQIYADCIRVIRVIRGLFSLIRVYLRPFAVSLTGSGNALGDRVPPLTPLVRKELPLPIRAIRVISGLFSLDSCEFVVA